jgi:diguanylate cyclase (GGDEF)-like protein/PAS domain S-box-containing protein
VVLLFGACAALLREPLGGGRRALGWIAAAMVAQSAGDLLYDVGSLNDTFRAGSYIDLVWLLAYWGTAMGAVSHRRELAAGGRAAEAASGARGWTLAREVLPYGAALVAYGTLVLATHRAVGGREALDLLGVIGGTTLVTALVVARQILATRENARLVRDAALRESEHRVSVLVRHSSDALLVVAHDGVVRFSSPAAERLFGMPEHELHGRPLVGVVHAAAADDVAAFLAAVRADGTARAIWRLDGDEGQGERYAEVVGTDLLSEPTVGGVVLNVRDVTERTTFANRLAYLAFHDSLTGLVNRTRFRDQVDEAIAAAELLPADDATRPAVLFIDLDDFKTVNDSLGHAAGDRLLKVVAERLRNATRGCDTVARLGGDEFGVLLAGVRAERQAEVAAERIVESLRAPVVLGDSEVRVLASVGVALAPAGGGEDVDTLLRQADTAMYGAKRSGKGRFAVFGAEPPPLPAAA